jgi:ribosome biogenesis GTPase
MELNALGLNEWFVQKLNKSEKTDYNLARITAVNKDSYLIRSERSEIISELTGEFIYSAESRVGYPVVGDWVFVQYYNNDTLAIIHDVLPRKTILRRKVAGKKIDYQTIASNIDVAFIIQSCDFDFNVRRLERYLVMINDGHIDPVILLSKTDLVSEKDLGEKSYRDKKYRCQVRNHCV